MISHESTPTTIVLVEDSDDDAFFFNYALQATGVPAVVTHLPGGGEAIDYFKQLREGGCQRPDLVFLDLKLPVYSGFDILEWLREHALLQSLHIAILSGSDHPSDLKTAREFGVTDYLVKPLSADELKRRLLAIRQSTSSTATCGRR